MTDWIHCNKCFQRNDKRVKLFITSCYHIECQTCISSLAGRSSKCLVCNTECQLMSIDNNLPSQISLYFAPFSQIMEFFKQICLFQFNNATSALHNVTHKYSLAKMEIMKLKKVIVKQTDEISKLKTILKTQNTRSYFGSGGQLSPVIGSGRDSTGNSATSTPLASKFMLWNKPKLTPYNSTQSNNSNQSTFYGESRDQSTSSIPTNNIPPFHRNFFDSRDNAAMAPLSRLNLGHPKMSY